ncbi:MAG: alpha/beta fold hydrolase [Nocardioidaceae bacterium]
MSVAPEPEFPGLQFYDVRSADGTMLTAWTNNAAGPTVLLCNGLGTNAYAWPAFLEPDCGVRVLSWNHRGVGGSERPADPDRVGVDAFVEDALAVMDRDGVDQAVVIGWSIGVNIAFELAVRHPDRVSGLFAMAGVPGGSFGSMLGPLWVPRPLRHPLTVGISMVLRGTGRVLSPATSRLPTGRLGTTLLRHSGFMFPRADEAAVSVALHEFLSTDVDWYFHLAVAASRHRRVSLRTIAVPTTFLAGKYDVLAGLHEIRTATERIPGAQRIELPGSHFVQMEFPDEVHAALLELLRRVGP